MTSLQTTSFRISSQKYKMMMMMMMMMTMMMTTTTTMKMTTMMNNSNPSSQHNTQTLHLLLILTLRHVSAVHSTIIWRKIKVHKQTNKHCAI
jgi:hypothetical protein